MALVDVELCWALHGLVCAGGDQSTGVSEDMLTCIWRRHLLLARSRATDDDEQGMVWCGNCGNSFDLKILFSSKIILA